MTAKPKLLIFFLGTAIAVLIAAGAWSIVLWQYRAIDRQANTHALDTAQSIHKYVQEQRVAHLEEASRTIATNPNFVSYITQALATNDVHGATDVASIRDLLDERRHDAGLDAAVILDASGKAVASVGDTLYSERDWSGIAMVAQVKKNPTQASAILNDDKRAFLVTATPLMRGTEIEALLLTGARIDEVAVKSLGQIGQSDLALIAFGPASSSIIASTLDAQDAQQFATLAATSQTQWQDHIASATGSEPFTVDVSGRSWSARLAPLHRSSQKVFLMALVPPARGDAVFRALATPVLAGAVAAILLLTIFALWLWRRVLRPLTVMDEFAARAMRGDHALELRLAGTGPIQRIASAFNQILKELARYRVAPGNPLRRATDRR